MRIKLVENINWFKDRCTQLVENYDNLEEVYFTPRNREIHYNRHVISDEDGPLKMDYMTIDEYDELADKLSSAEAGKINDRLSQIIGYQTKGGRFVKHDTLSKLTVVYVDDDINGHEAISLYKQPTNKFFRKLNDENSVMAFGNHI